MKVKNIVRKAVALGTGAGVFATTIVGALAYDLSTYPAKYIVDGQFDGKIVVGERAATADVLGSIDIAASLQSASTSAVSVPGQSGMVTLSGDNFKLATNADQLELREAIGDVADTITRTELAGLKSGRISTSQGTTDYNQFLRVQTSDNALVDMAVNFVKNRGVSTEVMSDYLVVPRDTTAAFIEWEIQFPQGLESERDGAALDDLEDKTLNIMGTDYTIVQASQSGTAISMVLMGGSVPDTLREGETKTYNINGVVYEVTLVFVSDPNTGGAEAKFSVNGELTDSMSEGGTEILSGGLQIGVRDILVNAREGVASFFLGADKLELDGETMDGVFGGSVTINDDVTESDVFAITASNTTTETEITSMKYRIFMDSAEGTSGIAFVPAGHGVRELMEEPDLLLSETLDIRYEGLTQPRTGEVLFDSVGDDQYDMTFTNVQGREYSFTLLTNDAGTVAYGEEDGSLVFIEPTAFNQSDPATYFIELDDFFIVGKNSGEDRSVTNVLEFTDYRRTQRQVEFREVGGGAVTATVDATTKTGTFSIGGSTFTVVVNETDISDPSIAVDLNGDGIIGDDDQVDITTWGGAIINLGAVAGDAATLNVSVPEKRFDSSAGGEHFLVEFAEVNTDELQVDFDVTSYAGPLSQGDSTDRQYDFWFEAVQRNSDTSVGMTDYGILITLDEPDGGDDQNTLTLAIPEEQRVAQVFVTMGATSASSTGTGGAQRVNPIAVGLAVLDTDAPAVGTENLIVVGGPCANTVAAELLGNPANCAEGFEPGRAVIRSWDVGNTVAILVAGYEATETLGASRVLASYKDYSDDLMGTEVEVVVADLNSIQVRAR